MATHPQAGIETDVPPVAAAAGATTWRMPAGAAAVLGWLADQLRGERARWFLWLPVAQGVGIALYFSLGSEPPLWLGPTLALSPLAALAWRRSTAGGRSPYEAPLLLGLAALSIGFAAAQLRTARVEAPVLTRPGAHEIVGRVLFVEERTGGAPRLRNGEPRLA